MHFRGMEIIIRSLGLAQVHLEITDVYAQNDMEMKQKVLNVYPYSGALKSLKGVLDKNKEMLTNLVGINLISDL